MLYSTTATNDREQTRIWGTLAMTTRNPSSSSLNWQLMHLFDIKRDGLFMKLHALIQWESFILISDGVAMWFFGVRQNNGYSQEKHFNVCFKTYIQIKRGYMWPCQLNAHNHMEEAVCGYVGYSEFRRWENQVEILLRNEAHPWVTHCGCNTLCILGWGKYGYKCS